MKNKIIISLLLVVLVAIVFTACAGNNANENSTKTKCTISVSVDGNYILDGYEYDAVATNVLQAAADALLLNDIDYEFDSNGKSFAMIKDVDGTEYASGQDAEGKNICAWVPTVNNEEPKSRAGDIKLEEGMGIEFTYFREPIVTSDNSETEE